jgi:hypothetical protein
MLTQNFRASAQSALIASIMAVSTFALVIGPDPVRYAALAALLVLTPSAMLAIRLGAIVTPEVDMATLKSLEINAAPKVDQVLIAAAWLGAAGAFMTGLAATVQFDIPGGLALRIAALAAAALLAVGATPVIAGLIRPLPVVGLSASGVRLSHTRQIRWKDIESIQCLTLGVNRLVIVLKPCPRDPGGPPKRIRVRLPAVVEPWVRTTALAMIARQMGDIQAAD